ncbi:AAA ATPase [Cichlidogyrus casuarinus]|uniref:AAA ATPase n=1 Tax=Cichlidogyrus casuarinus TaxID=1844966 RepID=A0ABD2Q1X3_9PLAT
MRTRSSLRPIENTGPTTPLRVANKRSSVRPAIKRESIKPKVLSTPKKTTLISSVLHGAFTDELVAREAETKAIRSLLQSITKDMKNSAIYISGAPGTGKTATVTQEVARFQSEFHACSIFVNCMQVDTPSSIYQFIAERLSICLSSHKGVDAKLLALEQALDKRTTPLVIVLDEIDQLATRQQDVLYRIYEWPQRLKSPLIVTARLNSLASEGMKMEPMAVQFCARKVSASSGDVRKALAICRRAVELALLEVREDKENPDRSAIAPSIKHVNLAIKEAEVSPDQVVSGPGLPLQHKIVLACCVLLRQKRGTREFPMGVLHETYNRVCEARKVAACEMSEFASICELLDSHGLLRVTVPGPKANALATPSRMKKVALSLDDKGLEKALNDQSLLTSILSTSL